MKYKKNFSHDIQIGYKDKYTVQTSSTKLLSSIIDDALCWENHTDYITAKLNSACFAVRSVKSLL
jgi:hypothetical protein